jgi:hypothetical protein
MCTCSDPELGKEKKQLSDMTIVLHGHGLNHNQNPAGYGKGEITVLLIVQSNQNPEDNEAWVVHSSTSLPELKAR